MKKIVFLFFALVASVALVQAQNAISPFIRGGVSFPWYSLDSKLFTTSSIVGFQAGAGAIIDAHIIEFEPSVQVAMRGTKLKNAIVTTSQSLLYVDVPLMVNLPLTIGQTGVFAGVGGMFSYAVAGWSSVGSSKSEKMNLSDELKNRIDLSVRAHGGVRIYGHQLSLFYERGFINLSPIKSYTIYNNGWGILYSYIFK